MAEQTSIAWTDSTFNPWLGCTKVGPGCDACYAEAEDARRKWGGATHWGAGVPRHRTSAAYWRNPFKWDAKAAKTGERWLVFCASLADVFDNEVPDEWRADLWRLIRATPNLTWQILTKRIGNAERMWPGGDYQNVWIGATVVNQEEADRDIPKLRTLPVAVRFLSVEPMLEQFDLCLMPGEEVSIKCGSDRGIHWVIVGGESGPKRRPFEIAWLRSVVEQCRAASVPVFVKQDAGPKPGHRGRIPDDLWIKEFPA